MSKGKLTSDCNFLELFSDPSTFTMCTVSAENTKGIMLYPKRSRYFRQLSFRRLALFERADFMHDWQLNKERFNEIDSIQIYVFIYLFIKDFHLTHPRMCYKRLIRVVQIILFSFSLSLSSLILISYFDSLILDDLTWTCILKQNQNVNTGVQKLLTGSVYRVWPMFEWS